MPSKRRHEPVRTCIVCRSCRPKNELLRLAVDRAAGVVMPDRRGVREGRGAYVCKGGPCLSDLSRVKNIHRVFRVPHPLSLSPELERGGNRGLDGAL